MKDFILRLVHPTPLKAGVVTIFLALFAYYGGLHNARIFEYVDRRIYDVMFLLRGARPTTGDVVVVDIDEKSLRDLGQWPWPRNVVAKLIGNIDEAGALVSGLDIVFAEPDRTSPSRYFPELKKHLPEGVELPATGLDYDAVLGETLGRTTTVVGYFFQMSDDGLDTELGIPCPELTIPVSDLKAAVTAADLAVAVAYRPVLNVPEVSENSLTEGCFNALPDFSGVVRQVSLFVQFRDLLYPHITVEMLREGLGVDVTLGTAPNGIVGVKFGDRLIPTADGGQMWLNYRGPPRTFPYISAVDVFEKRAEALSALAGKYVLVGTSVWGLRDLRSTPFAVAHPGVEILATAIDNILSGDPMRQDRYTEWGLVLSVVFGAGLILTGLLTFTNALIGGVAGFAFLAGIAVFDYYGFFLHGQLVGVTYPMCALIVVFIVVTLVNYFSEGREKRFIRGAFSHYVSADVVAQLVKSPDKLSLEGEERVLSCMFSDIRGFTSISEQLSARDMSAFLNEYLTDMTDIVMEQKGTVDKFIGDAIMAIWGAPVEDEQHAANCVRTGLIMLDRLAGLRQGWEQRGLPYLDIGVGVNTGIMRVGNMGSRSRFDYTVIGDNVNLASRLEGLNKEYGTHCLITEATLRELDGQFLCRLVDMVKVKGKSEPVKIYEPLVEGEGDEELRREIETFEAALADYRGQNFESARSAFSALQQEHPQALYELYLERLEEYRQNPPPADWDGVYVFTHK